MPELDEGVLFWWIGRNVYQRRTYVFVNQILHFVSRSILTMMAVGNHIVGIVSPVMMPNTFHQSSMQDSSYRFSIPVKGQVVTRYHLDGVMRWNIAQDIASQVNGSQVLHGGIVVAALARCAVVGWDPDALERTLVHAIDVHAL